MKKFFRFIKETPVATDVILLIFSVSIIHLFYVLYVDPISTVELDLALSSGKVPSRTVWLVLKDFEQELCLILALWCLLLLGARYKIRNDDNQLISLDFLSLSKKDSDLDTIQKSLEEAESLRLEGHILPGVRVYMDAFRLSGSPEHSKREAIDFYNLTEEALDARLNLVSYILWAIPSIGFLGTVRGIGQALADIDQALSGDIAGVALNLGIAFNSTFVAILLSVFLTFVSMAMRGRETDRLVQCKTYISESLSKKLTTSSI